MEPNKLLTPLVLLLCVCNRNICNGFNLTSANGQSTVKPEDRLVFFMWPLLQGDQYDPPSTSSHQDIYDPLQRRRKVSCDPKGVSERCFQRLWSGSSDMLTSNCDNFEKLEHCLEIAYQHGCDDPDASHVAAGEFVKAQGKLLPPELFSELRTQLRSSCYSKCDDEYLERQCRIQMKLADQEKDYALQLEFDGQLRQYRLEMMLPMQGCKVVRQTLNKWLSFRRRVCGDAMAACLCQKMKMRLDSIRCQQPCEPVRTFAPSLRSVSSGTSNFLRSEFLVTSFIVLLFLYANGTWNNICVNRATTHKIPL